MQTKVKLVKIVIKCLKGAVYQVGVGSLIQEIKMKRNLEARLPKLNEHGVMVMPTDVEDKDIVDDWERGG